MIPYLFCCMLTRKKRLAEVAVGIIVGCMPSLPRFFQNMFSVDSRLRLLLSRSPFAKSWSSIFSWSSRSKRSKKSQNSSDSEASQGNSSRAPKIPPLNMTKVELDVEEMELWNKPRSRNSLNVLPQIQDIPPTMQEQDIEKAIS